MTNRGESGVGDALGDVNRIDMNIGIAVGTRIVDAPPAQIRTIHYRLFTGNRVTRANTATV